MSLFDLMSQSPINNLIIRLQNVKHIHYISIRNIVHIWHNLDQVVRKTDNIMTTDYFVTLYRPTRYKFNNIRYF